MIRKTLLAVSSLACAGLLAFTPAPAEAQRTVTCESRGNDVTRCAVDTRGGVRIVRQISESSCQRGRSWGADSRGIWVSRGCRAQFETGGRGGYRDDRRRDDRRDRGNDRWDRRADDRYDRREDRWERGSVRERAERVCRNVVRDRYRYDRGGVSTDFRSADRYGNAVIRWSTDRARGTCTVTPAGRVVDLRASRR